MEPVSPPTPPVIEVSAAEILRFVWKNSLTVWATGLIGAVLAVILLLTGDDTYLSSFTVLPRDEVSSLREMLLPSQGSTKRSYIQAILKSQSLQVEIFEKFRGDEEFWEGIDNDKRNLAASIKITDSLVEMDSETSETISVRTTCSSARLAQNLTGAYYSFLVARIEKDDSDNSSDLQKIVTRVADELTDSRKRMRAFMENRKIYLPIEKFAEFEFAELSELRRLSDVTEARLSGLSGRLDAPGELNDIMRLKSDKLGAEEELSVLDSTIDSKSSALSSMPENWEQYSLLIQELDVRQEVLKTVTQEYELIRLRTQEQKRPYRLIDPPSLEPIKLRKRPVFAGGVGLIVGLAIGFLIVSSRSFFRATRATP